MSARPLHAVEYERPGELWRLLRPGSRSEGLPASALVRAVDAHEALALAVDAAGWPDADGVVADRWDASSGSWLPYEGGEL